MIVYPQKNKQWKVTHRVHNASSVFPFLKKKMFNFYFKYWKEMYLMSIVNTQTFFFPKLYLLKVTELGEKARKASGAGGGGRRKGLGKEGIRTDCKGSKLKRSCEGWKQEGVE